jgi:hypothetical protein
MTTVQSCVICAWRANCAKRFSVSDGGARCPDFSRDVSIKHQPDESDVPTPSKEQAK